MSPGERDPIVLLHGSANGSYSWGAVSKALTAAGERVLAVDMLGYGAAPKPKASWSLAEEVEHLVPTLDQHGAERIHLVPHSLGAFFGLHLRLALGERVSRLTLVDPLVFSALREFHEDACSLETERVYESFLGKLSDPPAAARLFVDYWNAEGAWDAIGERARSVIAALVPRVEREMAAARSDSTPLATLAASPPPTTILLGEKTKAAPRATARHLASAFAANLIEVAGAGHMIPLTHPQAVVSAALRR